MIPRLSEDSQYVILEIIGKFQTHHSYKLVSNLREWFCNQRRLIKIFTLEYETKPRYFGSTLPNNHKINQEVRDSVHRLVILFGQVSEQTKPMTYQTKAVASSCRPDLGPTNKLCMTEFCNIKVLNIYNLQTLWWLLPLSAHLNVSNKHQRTQIINLWSTWVRRGQIRRASLLFHQPYHIIASFACSFRYDSLKPHGL